MKLIISVIIIKKKEEEMLGDCLNAVSPYVNEIIIVDGQSQDKTIEVAKHFTKKIIVGKFETFKEKRERGLQAAKEPWILFLDADERVSPALAEEIKQEITKKDAC